MREDILEAGIRVLSRDGLRRLTTPRIAKVAGISVGSLYQYFPNKEAILFAIHSRTVAGAWIEVQRILDADTESARTKIRLVAELFFHSETKDVATMGSAAQDIDQYFKDHPQSRALNEQIFRRFTEFVREAMPKRTKKARVELLTQLLVTVIESVGRSVALRQLPGPVIDAWAAAIGDMLADFIGRPLDMTARKTWPAGSRLRGLRRGAESGNPSSLDPSSLNGSCRRSRSARRRA
jgi:AcrR family transcriptional regulator